MQKYVCAYIVECLTGIRGENPERVYEVISTTEADMKDGLLQLVLDMARYDPANQEVKDAVAAIVVGYTVIENEKIGQAVAETAKELAKTFVAKKEPKKSDKALTLVYSKEGNTVFFSAFDGLKYLSFLRVPYELKDYIIEQFIIRFPKGHVIEA
jgi:hypothetical protein